MKKSRTAYFAVALSGLLLLLTGCGGGGEAVSLDEAPYNEGIHIIPRPVEMTPGEAAGRWTLSAKTRIVGEESLAPVTRFLHDKVVAATGFDLPIEAARLLGVSRQTIYRWMEEGLLRPSLRRKTYEKYFLGSEILRAWEAYWR